MQQRTQQQHARGQTPPAASSTAEKPRPSAVGLVLEDPHRAHRICAHRICAREGRARAGGAFEWIGLPHLQPCRGAAGRLAVAAAVDLAAKASVKMDDQGDGWRQRRPQPAEGGGGGDAGVGATDLSVAAFACAVRKTTPPSQRTGAPN
jgi:hypothetical protein